MCYLPVTLYLYPFLYILMISQSFDCTKGKSYFHVLSTQKALNDEEKRCFVYQKALIRTFHTSLFTTNKLS